MRDSARRRRRRGLRTPDQRRSAIFLYTFLVEGPCFLNKTEYCSLACRTGTPHQAGVSVRACDEQDMILPVMGKDGNPDQGGYTGILFPQ
ncbi:hypothetical protein ACRRTK_004468 [Alexandromys fortis]